MTKKKIIERRRIQKKQKEYKKQKRRQPWKSSKKGRIIHMEESKEKWTKLKRNW